MAQRKGAITKQAHSTTKKYFKNVYNLGGFQEWVESGGEIQPNV